MHSKCFILHLKLLISKECLYCFFPLAKTQWVCGRQSSPHHDNKLLNKFFGILPYLKIEQNIKRLQNSESSRLVLGAVFGEKEKDKNCLDFFQVRSSSRFKERTTMSFESSFNSHENTSFLLRAQLRALLRAEKATKWKKRRQGRYF